jgi:hypothetical protein
MKASRSGGESGRVHACAEIILHLTFHVHKPASREDDFASCWSNETTEAGMDASGAHGKPAHPRNRSHESTAHAMLFGQMRRLLVGLLSIAISFTLAFLVRTFLDIRNLKSAAGAYALEFSSTGGRRFGTGNIRIYSLKARLGPDQHFPYFYVGALKQDIQASGVMDLTVDGRTALTALHVTLSNTCTVVPDQIESDGFFEIQINHLRFQEHLLWCALRPGTDEYSGTVYYDTYNPMSRTAVGTMRMKKLN